MKYLTFKCYYKNVYAAISDGKKLLYYKSNKLESHSYKEQNRKVVSNLAKECLDYLRLNGINRISINIIDHNVNIRDAFIDEIINSEVEILCIKDMTPIPHNACRIHETQDKKLNFKRVTVVRK